MNGHELWLTYHQASRANHPSTAQLVDLHSYDHKLYDLEDVLEHIFAQGFIEAKYRSQTFWECKDGAPLKASHPVGELLSQGLGTCQDSALKLIIRDVIPGVWFKYHFVSGDASGHAVTQRVKFESLPHQPCHTDIKLAHITNYIFQHGYLPAKLRSKVYWEGVHSKRIPEAFAVHELLTAGQGTCEDHCLKLVVDAHAEPQVPHHHHDEPHHCPCQKKL